MKASESANTITVICPNLGCSQTLHVPASSRGKVVKCGMCQTPFRVPVAPSKQAESSPDSDKSPPQK